MRKVIAAINMTINGDCDHTVGLSDEEIHHHYAELLNDAGVILYGRITYELMKFWQPLVENPSGKKSMDDFALAIDNVPKIIFSHTMKDPEWASAELSDKTLEEKVSELKQQPGKDIFVGSRSIIIQLMKLNLIDEYQLCVQPVVSGGNLPLFENFNERIVLKLVKTKTFSGGAIILYYTPTN